MDQHYAEIIKKACNDNGFEVCEHKLTNMLRYLELLVKWNRAYNLSAIRDPEQMLYKHLLDSLSIVPFVQKSSAKRFIDVGTGAGLPGIPLAICFPEKTFTLLDSAGKKVRFLRQVAHELELTNVEPSHTRVEHHRPDMGYDVVMSRAFASITDFTSWCEHLLSERGEFWAMKGVFPENELSMLEKRYTVQSCSTLSVPGGVGERCLVVIQTNAA